MKNPTNKFRLFAVLLSLLMMSAYSIAQNNAPSPARPAAPQTQGPSPVAPADPQADWVTKFFEMKNINGVEMKSILSIFRADLVVPNVGGEYKIISVRAPREIMPAIEETIARFDVPPPPQPARVAVAVKSIEVSVQVMGAYDGPAPSCAGCAIPQSLQPVITQLQKNFSYKNYLLLDSQLYRQADRTGISSVNTLAAMNDTSATYNISWQAWAYPDTKSIQLTSLKFGADVRMPGRDQNTHFGFDTSQVQIPVDQQIVIGKTTVGTNTVFLVIRAKVLD